MAIKIQGDTVIYDDKVFQAGSGTTAQRPSAPQTGMIRFNTDLDSFEGYDGTAWSPLGGSGNENAIPPPDTLGESYRGGFYIGTICAANTCYYLIVAPNATGCAFCQWKTTRTTTAGTTSNTDGFANTYGPMDNAEHPAGNWTATRTINGFGDWYLPAKDELNQLYVNDGGRTNTTLPAGEGFASDGYWSSTEFTIFGPTGLAFYQDFFDGYQFDARKTDSYSVRAVRREPI